MTTDAIEDTARQVLAWSDVQLPDEPFFSDALALSREVLRLRKVITEAIVAMRDSKNYVSIPIQFGIEGRDISGKQWCDEAVILHAALSALAATDDERGDAGEGEE